MSNQYLEKVQNFSYDILKEFDKFCEKHNLTYFICAGTLLGAIRHGGFIPWDDDIDVSMPREDYDKLINEYEKLLPPNLILQYYKNTANYANSFAKITNKNTTIVEKSGFSDYSIHGVYIDIFPIDGAGKTYEKAVKRRKKASLYRTLISLSSRKIDTKNKPLWKKIFIRLFSKLNAKKFQDMYSNFLRKKPYSQSNYVAVFVSPYGLKEIMKREIYELPKKIKFREHYFNAPFKADVYLQTIYGDYMQLPPEEKRKSNHNIVFVDVNLPYKDFDLNSLSKK